MAKPILSLKKSPPEIIEPEELPTTPPSRQLKSMYGITHRNKTSQKTTIHLNENAVKISMLSNIEKKQNGNERIQYI